MKDLRYFNWLVDKIDCDERGRDYLLLLRELYNTEFYWSVNNDINREEDGYHLKIEYAEEVIPFEIQDVYGIGNGFCSVLEMMIALARRIENDMYDPDFGDRTCVWFWIMVDNLGLGHMENDEFNTEEYGFIIDRFLNREFKRDGRGSIFCTKRSDLDFRNVEFWYQAQFWMDENLTNFEDF